MSLPDRRPPRGLSAVFQRAMNCALAPKRRRFEAALDQPQTAQEALLRELVAGISRTHYGQSHGLRANDGIGEFRAKLPIATYVELEPWIEKQRAGQTHAISPGVPRTYEKTSGSSGRAKFIPYTPELLGSFNEMALLWADDVVRNGPGLQSARTFMSLSPAFREGDAGFADDSEYLGFWSKLLFGHRLVLPPALKSSRTPEEYFGRVLVELFLARDLEVFFVWNPSYLTSLFDQARARKTELLGAVRLRDPKRADEIERLWPNWNAVWPDIRWISCWTSGASAHLHRELRAIFPRAWIQGKGLLATEAPLTLPWIEASGEVPLVTEVFFEFLDSSGVVRVMSEIQEGERYELVITQKSGLTRYRMGDQVVVGPRFRGAPTLIFVGRAGVASDLVGEKMDEAMASHALQGQGMLVPIPEARPARYLWIHEPLSDREDAHARAAEIEARLRDSFHYDQARKLGQLAPVEPRELAELGARYLDFFAERGMKRGDIKFTTLFHRWELAREFLRKNGITEF